MAYLMHTSNQRTIYNCAARSGIPDFFLYGGGGGGGGGEQITQAKFVL